MRLFLTLVFTLTAALANDAVVVSDGWARATVPGQQVGGVYLTLRSSQKAVLLEARCDCATTVQIHLSEEKSGVASMREQKTVALAAGRKLEFKPGGLHIMLLGLKAPLRAGQTFPVLLVVEENGKRSQLTLQVAVRPITATDDAHHGHQH